MTTINKDETANLIGGIKSQTYQVLTENPKTRPIFMSIMILLKVYPIVVLILGSLGNLLSFFVLLRTNMRRYSTFCYLACLAVVDLGVIITFSTNFISLYHYDYDIQNVPFQCKLFAFCIYFLPQYSSWILVAVSIDRVISAKYLHLAKTWSKPRHSVLVTLLLGFFLAVLNSHHFLYENNSNMQNDAPQIVQSNQTAVERVLLNRQNLDETTFMNRISGERNVNSSSLSYQILASSSSSSIQSIFGDTTSTQQHDNTTTVVRKKSLLFDVNQIHCSLESSPQHALYYTFWVVIDLLMNVFLPFTGK